MTVLTLESFPVLSAIVSMPRNGAWFAELQIAGERQLSGQVTMSDGSSAFLGSVIPGGGAYAGRTFVRLVGGSGGLGKVLNPRHYRSAGVGKILGDICSDADESKSPLIDPRLSQQRVSFWTRNAGTGGSAVANLAESLKTVWRILPTGQVWIGDPELALAAPAEFPVLNRDPFDNTYTIAIDDLSLWVGMSQNAGIIRRIEYAIDSTARAKYWVD
jgi:hypothetical protein